MPSKDIERRRETFRKASAKWYAKNKQKRLQHNKDHKKRNKDLVRSIKSTKSCVECGESHPACLEFHHVDPTKKTMEIARMVHRQIGVSKILEEMNKCVVLCSNCHRKLHYKF